MHYQYYKLLKLWQPTPRPEDYLIIHHPEAMSVWRKRTEWTLTTLGWLIWLFFVRPLFILILWLFGFRLFVEHMIILGGGHAIGQLAISHSCVILLLYIVLRGWNFYNARAFRGKERRRKNRQVTTEEIEKFFQLPAGTIDNIQKCDCITVDFLKEYTVQVSEGIDEEKRASVRGYFKPS